MGLVRSLSIGTSSLIAHQKRMDVISNNLANANTIGYKSSRMTFAEQFSQTYRHGTGPSSNTQNGIGGVDPLQYGLGVKVGSTQMNMGQGIIESTDRPLDMAINGSGFFIYNDNGTQKYSRAGAVKQDREGYLVDSNSGAFLSGYNVQTDSTGKANKTDAGDNILDKKISNIRIKPSTISLPKQTTNIEMNGNLDSAMKTTDLPRPTTVKIFDQNGAAHDLTINISKAAAPNQFTLSGSIDGKTVTLSATTIEFNPEGTLKTPLNLTVTAANLNTALGNSAFNSTAPKNLDIRLADPNNLTSGSMTQFAGATTATIASQDGYQAGNLLSTEVDSTGKILGSFSNGKTEVLAQAVLANFVNPEGLLKQGGNFYIGSPNSGEAIYGNAVENFASTRVIGRSLEQSNVEMTEQFTDMISTQRAYEAASRTITVSDQMLSEINQLKR